MDTASELITDVSLGTLEETASTEVIAIGWADSLASTIVGQVVSIIASTVSCACSVIHVQYVSSNARLTDVG